MRTGRKRLLEWIEDIQSDPLDAYGFPAISASEWADLIMQDINMGIIAPEDEEPRRMIDTYTEEDLRGIFGLQGERGEA